MRAMELNTKKSQALKYEGQEVAERSRADLVALARRAARYVAETGDGTCTMDLVHAAIMKKYSWWTPAALGPAAGAVFKSGEWVDTGRRVPSAHVKNHARELRVWELKSPVNKLRSPTQELESKVTEILRFWEAEVNGSDQTRTTGIANLRNAVMEQGYDKIKMAVSRYAYDLKRANSNKPLGLQKFFGPTIDAPFRQFLTAYRDPRQQERKKAPEPQPEPEPQEPTRSPQELLDLYGVESFKDLLGKKIP